MLEGEIEYLLEGEWRCAPTGTTVFIPAGTIHAFRNDTGRPARQLAVGPPGAVELITELAGHPPNDRSRSMPGTGRTTRTTSPATRALIAPQRACRQPR